VQQDNNLTVIPSNDEAQLIIEGFSLADFLGAEGTPFKWLFSFKDTPFAFNRFKMMIYRLVRRARSQRKLNPFAFQKFKQFLRSRLISYHKHFNCIATGVTVEFVYVKGWKIHSQIRRPTNNIRSAYIGNASSHIMKPLIFPCLIPSGNTYLLSVKQSSIHIKNNANHL
jgi:hypothetical protein